MQQIQSYRASKGDISRLVSTDGFQLMCQKFSDTLWRPDKSEFVSLITNPDIQDDMFPDKQLVVFWEPYRPIISNFEYIYDTSPVFISGSPSRCKAVSFINQILCKKGLRYDMEFYGTSTISMLQHVCNYFQLLDTSGFHEELEVHINLYFPMCVDSTMIRNTMTSWGLLPGYWSHHSHYVLLQTEAVSFPAKL